MQNLLLLFSSIAMFAGALFGGMYLGRKGQKESKEKAIDKRSEAKEIILEAEDEARRIRLSTAETEKVLQQRSERVDQKESQLLAKEKSLEEAKVLQNKKIEEIEEIRSKQVERLEKASGFTREEAKKIVLDAVEHKLAGEIGRKIREAEGKIRSTADEKAKEIILEAMHSASTDYVAEYTISKLSLPTPK